MTDIFLRPHHGLCIHFFEGKGYSSEFTEHMSKTIARLQKPNTRIVLTMQEDEICRMCPNYLETGCSSKDKVEKYDRKVLKLTGLKCDIPMPFSKLQATVADKIIAEGKMSQVCADCGWAQICHQSAQRILSKKGVSQTPDRI